MDYTNWTKEDLISEIIALTNTVDKRAKKIADKICQKYDEDIKHVEQQFKDLIELSIHTRVAEAEKLLLTNRTNKYWNFLCRRSLADAIPFGVEYHLSKLIEELEKNKD